MAENRSVTENRSMAENKKESHRSFSPAIVIITCLIVAGLISIIVIQYQQLRNLHQGSDSVATNQQDVQRLVAKVSQLTQLPQEEPYVATIQNIDEIQNQAFFSFAKNGDKVLIFPAAKKAVIYRESDHKLINMGPIEINNSATNSAADAEQSTIVTPETNPLEVSDGELLASPADDPALSTVE